MGWASWRSGYAEDCKSLHPGSIPGEASIDLASIPFIRFLLTLWVALSPGRAR